MNASKDFSEGECAIFDVKGGHFQVVPDAPGLKFCSRAHT